MANGRYETEAESWTKNDQHQTNIMIVDDEKPILRLLSRICETDETYCVLASNAEEARGFLNEQHFDLILCDVNMPGESGIDFIRYSLQAHPDTAVMMVSAADDPDIANAAIEIGAYGYIIKPFKPNELKIHIRNALRRRKLEIESKRLRDSLEEQVVQRTAKLQEMMEKLRTTMEGIIQAMALTVESRDPYTAGHQRRVADLACAIARKMKLSEDRIEGIRMAGQIHDLGKISVPAEILVKPTRLTDAEFNLIKVHPQVGYDILKNIAFPWPIAQMVVQHHEREDGSGYPFGLKADEILPESKILIVADVIEAMASHRPYRPALGIEAALEEMNNHKGILYDPLVVEAAVAVISEDGFQF